VTVRSAGSIDGTMADRIEMLEAQLGLSVADYTRLSWELTQARAAKAVEDKALARKIERAAQVRRGEVVNEPTDETARKIIQAGP
jgi:hypothetical protein